MSSFVGLFFNARFADAFVSVVGEKKSLPLLLRRNYQENEEGDISNCGHIYIRKNGQVQLEQLSF